MPHIARKPVVKTIQLLELDKSGDTFVIIRQATQGDFAILQEFNAETRTVVNPITGQGEQIRRYNGYGMAAERVYRCLVGCNMQKHINPEDETAGTVDVFKFNVDRDGKPTRGDYTEFMTAWNGLTIEESSAIYEALLDVNPQWNYDNPGE